MRFVFFHYNHARSPGTKMVPFSPQRSDVKTRVVTSPRNAESRKTLAYIYTRAHALFLISLLFLFLFLCVCANAAHLARPAVGGRARRRRDSPRLALAGFPRSLAARPVRRFAFPASVVMFMQRRECRRIASRFRISISASSVSECEPRVPFCPLSPAFFRDLCHVSRVQMSESDRQRVRERRPFMAVSVGLPRSSRRAVLVAPFSRLSVAARSRDIVAPAFSGQRVSLETRRDLSPTKRATFGNLWLSRRNLRKVRCLQEFYKN